MAPLNNIYDANICVGEVPGDRYEGTACSRMETGIFQPSPHKKKKNNWQLVDTLSNKAFQDTVIGFSHCRLLHGGLLEIALTVP